MSQTIKLQTNVPVSGTIKYADYKGENFNEKLGKTLPAQIRLNGNFDGQDGYLYLPLPLESEMQKLGIIGQRTQNNSYQVLKSAVRLCKREEGTRKYTDVQLTDGQRSPQQSHSPPSQPAAQPNRGSTPTDILSRATHEDAKKAFWGALDRTMGECVKLAKKLWSDTSGGGINPDVVASTAHTLFIEVARKDMWREAIREPAPALVTPAQLDQIAFQCGRLGYDDAWLTQELANRFNVQSVHNLTESAATGFVNVLAATPASATEDIPF